MHSELILKLPRQPLFLHILNFGEHGSAKFLIIFFCRTLEALSIHQFHLQCNIGLHNDQSTDLEVEVRAY